MKKSFDKSPSSAKASAGKQELGKYISANIEKKWQKTWEKEKTYQPNLDKASKPFYNLMMFPYPSAEGLHVGNMYAFTGADVYGRFQRMQGNDVLEPIGLDGFGIHAENYALKIGKHPMEYSKVTEANFYRQLHAIGNGFDWSRTVETYKPNYYKWTQWLFVELFKAGLAYRKKQAVNYCPSCKTVLADEQVIDGKCERCGTVVEKRELEQWFFKITSYADRLLENIKSLNWSERVKIAQRAWIGKKEGIRIHYKIQDSEEVVEVFTTRPDTNFGATFIAIAPEHPLALRLATKEKRKVVEEYIKESKSKSEYERQAEGREKTGVFTGSYAINDLTGYKMPIWISDFVLTGFGTGALVGVPGHDKRDFEFAKKFDLEVKRVVMGKDNDKSAITRIDQVQEKEGTMVHSDFLNGLAIHEAIAKIIDHLEEKGLGKREVSYHLRDWLISRQRYWGAPIPMIYCENCAKQGKGELASSDWESAGWYAEVEEKLPVVLPHIKNYKPLGTGKSPLALDEKFMSATCPGCGGEAVRETDVSDTFLDSAWYFFRYTSTELEDKAFDKDRVKKWLPVNMYIGGAEHSVLHLLYSRFMTMFLHDQKLIGFEEPYARFYAHGLLIKEGSKMSKSKGNVVIPDAYIAKFGADTVRTYLMFLGPYDQGGDFRDSGIEGMHRFLKRIWVMFTNTDFLGGTSEATNSIVHKTIKGVTGDMEKLHFNTAIAKLMTLYNAFAKQKNLSIEHALVYLKLLAPFAPHMTEEIWQMQRSAKRGEQSEEFESIHIQPWPTYEEKYLQEDVLTIVVQVNGKVRENIQLQAGISTQQSEVEKRAKESKNVKRHLEGKTVKKVVYIEGKLLNFVTY